MPNELQLPPDRMSPGELLLIFMKPVETISVLFNKENKNLFIHLFFLPRNVNQLNNLQSIGPCQEI